MKISNLLFIIDLLILRIDGRIGDSGEQGADDGAKEIHVPVGPVHVDEGGAEPAGWVHGGTGEGSTDQDIRGDDTADDDAGVFGVFVGGGDGENGPDEEEGQDGFSDRTGEG